MLRIAQEKVQLFMERVGEPTPERPELGDLAEGQRRYAFIKEELEEYLEALLTDDLVKIADALGDLEYVILGTAVHHGIQLEPIFNEVHRSNMTKTPEAVKTVRAHVTGECKRVVKGPGYEPPRLAELLMLQATGLCDAVTN